MLSSAKPDSGPSCSEASKSEISSPPHPSRCWISFFVTHLVMHPFVQLNKAALLHSNQKSQRAKDKEGTMPTTLAKASP